MTIIRAHIHVFPDGTITGSAPGAAPGEHDVAIMLSPARQIAEGHEAVAAIRAIQRQVAQHPVLDARPADEIVGYGEDGLFE